MHGNEVKLHSKSKCIIGTIKYLKMVNAQYASLEPLSSKINFNFNTAVKHIGSV